LPVVALSTMWAKDRFGHMAEFVAKAQELGFTHIEANHWISAQMLSELIQTSFPISSVHSPCPAALSSSGAATSKLSLSSLDESERIEAVRSAKQTIDLASNLGARAVVLHMGEVPIDLSLEDELRRLYTQGSDRSPEQARLRRELIQQRASQAPPYFDAARASLEELGVYGQNRGVVLGIETRFHLHEIPSIDEVAEFLDTAPEGTAGYWHDVGHAEVQERLGFGSHAAWLSRFRHRMIGVHLHDIVGICDHHAPGKGDMNWKMIAGNLPSGIVRVCEIGEWNDERQLQGVVAFLQSVGIAD
jgi:sugar phosphate isomerase/epimerase